MDPSAKAKEIIKKMENLEQLKQSLNTENKQAQERMSTLERQLKQREAAQRQMEGMMSGMTNSQML